MRAQLAMPAAMLGWLAASGAQAETVLPPLPQTGATELLEQFSSNPEQNGGVSLDAWVQHSAAGEREMVVVVIPNGRAKLVADPGITVAPIERSGIEWTVPLPHRHVDSAVEYFTPPAAIHLPFAATDDLPIELRVEYAWCLVEYQCFLGEETLRVANRIE